MLVGSWGRGWGRSGDKCTSERGGQRPVHVSVWGRYGQLEEGLGALKGEVDTSAGWGGELRGE